MITTNDWQTFFDHHAPRYMDEPFVQATLAEVDFLIEHLHLQPGMRVLDVGCGVGRHAVEFARRGYQVTGVDISRGMLEESQKNALNAGVSVEWIHTPAQEYIAPTFFDAVYSVCEGALSLLGEEDEYDRDLRILKNMFSSLKPGGYALITVLNGIRYLRMYHEVDIQSGRFDPLKMIEYGEMEIEAAEGKQRIPSRERGYIPTELRLMLHHTGFTIDRICSGTAGNWRLDPPNLDEMELMALAHRPGGLN